MKSYGEREFKERLQAIALAAKTETEPFGFGFEVHIEYHYDLHTARSLNVIKESSKVWFYTI